MVVKVATPPSKNSDSSRSRGQRMLNWVKAEMLGMTRKPAIITAAVIP